MSGRLIILPHKKWHVWTRDNIERVERDERLAKEAEADLAQKVAVAELEAKVERIKKGKGLLVVTESEVVRQNTTSSTTTHLNLFEGREAELLLGKSKTQTLNSNANPDYLKDKAEQEAKERRKHGIRDMKLGQSSMEITGKKPWYYGGTDSVETNNNMGDERAKAKANRRKAREERQKYEADPATEMARNLHTTTPRSSIITTTNSSEAGKKKKKKKKREREGGSSDDERAHKKHKSHKKPHKKGKKRTSSQKRSVESKEEKLARLRAERLAREQSESARESFLLAPVVMKGTHVPRDTWRSRKQRYHSQFNPLLARQNDGTR